MINANFWQGKRVFLTGHTGFKGKHVTAIASSEGIEQAEKALLKRGFESKTNFAASSLVALHAVTTFFNGDPVQISTFKRICDRLQLAWREIVELHTITTTSSDGAIEQVGALKETSTRVQPNKDRPAIIQAAAVRQRDESEAVIIIQGDSLPTPTKLRSALEGLLQDDSNYGTQVGSICPDTNRISIRGNHQNIKTLIKRFSTGELREINGLFIKNIYFLAEEVLRSYEKVNSRNKWNDIQEILQDPLKRQSLRAIDLSDADLKGINFKGADLSHADLSGADLSGANLCGADLSRANLSRANLNHAYLSDANLSRANLSSTNLHNAKILTANLSEAVLNRAVLIGAVLIGAHLNGATLSGAIFSGATLSGATFSGAILSGAILSNANLNWANLDDADLRRADLSDVNLRRASLRNTRLGRGWGLSNDEQRVLAERGAIFSDSED